MNSLRAASLATLLVVTATNARSQDRKDDSDRYVYKYAVVGKTKADQVERELSLEYDAEGDAQTALEEKKRDYYDSKGLLYATPAEDKPIAMRVAKFRYPKGSPSERKEVPPEAPAPGKGKPIEIPKLKFVDPGDPKRPSEKKLKAPELAGRTATRELDGKKTTIAFKKDKTFELRGEVTETGEWTVTDSGGVRLVTERSEFLGVLIGDTISGQWIDPARKQLPVRWQMKLNAPLALSLKEIAGSWSFDGTQQHWEFDLKPDGTVISFNGISTEVGKAVIVGDTVEIVCIVPDYGTPTPPAGDPYKKYVFRLVDGKLKGTVQRPILESDQMQARFKEWGKPGLTSVQRVK